MTDHQSMKCVEFYLGKRDKVALLVFTRIEQVSGVFVSKINETLIAMYGHIIKGLSVKS